MQSLRTSARSACSSRLRAKRDKDELAELGKKLGMHIAAAFPQALTADGLDAEVIERERAIAKEKAAESGKPENVQDKMVEGAVSKYRQGERPAEPGLRDG